MYRYACAFLTFHDKLLRLPAYQYSIGITILVCTRLAANTMRDLVAYHRLKRSAEHRYDHFTSLSLFLYSRSIHENVML